MKPTVGRTVHYTNTGEEDPPEPRAAIITKVTRREGPQHVVMEENFNVSLYVLYEMDYFFLLKMPFSEEYKRGHWTWPKREE